MNKKRRLLNQHKRFLWHNVPVKLQDLDMLIDCSEILHASIKMKTTGKVSRKVLKKWHKRDLGCGHDTCHWIPSTENGKFYWKCYKCRATTNWCWDFELSEPLKKAYPEHIRTYDEETRKALAQYAAMCARHTATNSESSISL